MERGVFSSVPNVKSAAQQFWAHRTGDEYLAANPLYIPGLIPILESAVATDSSFSPRSSAFAPLPSQPLDQRGKTAKKDPFLTLPQEMRIWGDVGSILDQISRLRNEGMIVD
jgi:hypothetical protein